MDSKIYKGLQQKRADLVAEQGKLFAAAEVAGAMSDEQKLRDDAIVAELKTVDADLERHNRRRAIEREQASAPAFLKFERGNNFATALPIWMKNGDNSALAGMVGHDENGREVLTIRGDASYMAASNATDMNVGTAADGGDWSPTRFFNQIIAKRDEQSIVSKLPLWRLPNDGRVVDIPVDNEDDGEFVATTEATSFDQDAPAVAKKTGTLVTYTKYTDISYQLLNSTPTNLIPFLTDFVGRGMAKTYNNLLVTEVAANGTNLKTFAGTTAIAFGELEAMVGNNNLADYLTVDNEVAWVTRSSTLMAIKSIVGSDRQYAVNTGNGPKELLGYPVHYSQKVAAQTTGQKPILFGNWHYVGISESPVLNFLRDPYSASKNGQVRLLWWFDAFFKVLQAEAIGYGTQA